MALLGEAGVSYHSCYRSLVTCCVLWLIYRCSVTIVNCWMIDSVGRNFLHWRRLHHEHQLLSAQYSAAVCRFGTVVAPELYCRNGIAFLCVDWESGTFYSAPTSGIITIIIILGPCLWFCHHDKTIARVHPVHLMNVEKRQAAADPQTKPIDLGRVHL